MHPVWSPFLEEASNNLVFQKHRNYTQQTVTSCASILYSVNICTVIIYTEQSLYIFGEVYTLAIGQQK